jgi:pyruvate dehydrogenase E2 component (dihydrolipoamide acetyltransferase)
MPTEILMPALSPTMEDGTLAKWLVKEGDTVNAGDILAEIETDKATMEFEAVDEGVIGKILVEEGTEGVKVNAPIAVLLEEGESADDIGSAPAAAPAPAAEAPAAAPEAAPAAAATPAPAAPAARRVPRLRLPARAPHREGQGPRPRRDQGLRPHGRIVKADVEVHRAPPAAAAAAPAPAAAAAAAAAGAAAAMPTARRPPRSLKMYEGREIRGGQARRHAQDRRRPPDRGQADDPAFLPAPRHPARRAHEIPLPAQQAAGRRAA